MRTDYLGNRLSQLLNELIETGLDERDTLTEKTATIKIFKKQAHCIFQEGLHDDLKILVKSRRTADLQEAVSIAIEEERSTKKRPTTSGTNRNRNSGNNTGQSYCHNCKRSGHSTKDCRRGNRNGPRQPFNGDKKQTNGGNTQSTDKGTPDANNGNHQSNNDNRSRTQGRRPYNAYTATTQSGGARTLPTATSTDDSDANEKPLRVAKMNQQTAGTSNFVSDEVKVQIKEARNNEVRMLIDSGAEVSVINKACVKDDIAWKESEVQLIAISGGAIQTLGEIEATDRKSVV